MNILKPLIVLLPGHDTRVVISGKKKQHSHAIIRIKNPNIESLLYDLPGWLLQDGFDTYLADFMNDGVKTSGIEELATWFGKELKKLIQKHPKKKIIIIGYSLGGLIVRAYIDGPQYPLDKKMIGYEFVSKAFLISVPNWGTGYHQCFNLMIDFAMCPSQIACREFSDDIYMVDFNAKYRHTNIHIPYYVIAGYGSQTVFGHLMTAFVWLTKGENNDGVATISNQLALHGAAEKAVVQASHVKDFGQTYFNKTVLGEMSEAYIQYIRPILLKEKIKWPTLSQQYLRTTPVWTYPVAALGWVVFCAMYSIRFVFARVKNK